MPSGMLTASSSSLLGTASARSAFPTSPCRRASRAVRRPLGPCCSAGGPGEQGKILRENEPDQFWQTKREAQGKNPAKDPVAVMGLLGIFLPFVILGIAIASGYIDTSVYRYPKPAQSVPAPGTVDVKVQS